MMHFYLWKKKMGNLSISFIYGMYYPYINNISSAIFPFIPVKGLTCLLNVYQGPTTSVLNPLIAFYYAPIAMPATNNIGRY